MTTKHKEVERSIKELSERFEDHFRRGEAEKLVEDYYVSDELNPVLSTPDAPMIEGQQAIAEAFTTLMSAFSDCKLEAVAIDCDGELAHELGRCDLTDQQGQPSTARYSILWRWTNRGWRVKTDFFAFGDLRSESSR